MANFGSFGNFNPSNANAGGPGRSVRGSVNLDPFADRYGGMPTRNQLQNAMSSLRQAGAFGGARSDVGQQLATRAREMGPVEAGLGGVLRSIKDQLADVQNRLSQLESGGGRRAQGGDVSTGSRNSNLAVSTRPPQVGKGGVLSTQAASFAGGTSADTTQTAGIVDATRSRLTDTFWEYASIQATGDLADPEELAKIEVTAKINGRPLPDLFKVPADVFSPSLDGPQLLPIFEYIGSDADIEIEFTTTDTLGTTSAEDIRVRMYSGDGSGRMYGD